MSDEDTDTESKQEKKLIRYKVPWLNHEIANLLHAVDTYEMAIDDECMANRRRGNRPLPRLPEDREGAKPKASRAVPKLPCNWYNGRWYGGLSLGEKTMLCARREREIPHLVRATGLFQCQFDPDVHYRRALNECNARRASPSSSWMSMYNSYPTLNVATNTALLISAATIHEYLWHSKIVTYLCFAIYCAVDSGEVIYHSSPPRKAPVQDDISTGQ